MGNTKAKQISIVNNLRGIASLMVFMFHLVCLSSGYISSKWINEVFRYGQYGVQFFFVISGYIIIFSLISSNYETRNFFTFLKKRIIRIEPPYIIIVFATVLFFILRNKVGINVNQQPSNIPSFSQVILHFGYLIPFSNYNWLSIVFWTLAIEFQFYIIFSLLIITFINNIKIRYLISICLLVLSFLVTKNDNFLYWSPVFLIGIFLALYKKQKISSIEFKITSLILFFCVFFRTGVEVLIFSVLPFLLILREPQFKNCILDFLGKISYSLYLCHTLVAFTIINLGIRYTHHFYQKCLFVGFAFFTTIIVSYLLYRFIEKPVQEIASSIKYRK